jgi:hypothetical protein
MSCLITQIIINKLPLPDELIDIIKDYAFYNIVDKTRETKNKIMSILVTIRIYHKTKLIWIRKRHAYGNERAEYCLICGDYLWSYTCHISKKIICKCDNPYINLFF